MRIKRIIHKIISYIIKRGLLGKRLQIGFFLGKSPTRLEHHNERLDLIVAEIEKNYEGVRVWRNIFGHRIGEFLARCCSLQTRSEIYAQNYYDIMVVSEYDKCNQALASIIDRSIPIVHSGNNSDWNYILLRISNIDYSHYYELDIRQNDWLSYSTDEVSNLLEMNSTETIYCEQKANKMELKKQYICFSSRDASFLRTITNADCSYHNYRDSDINMCNEAALYLMEKGYSCVRMGSVVKSKWRLKGVIDYAKDYYDELMDIYLFNNARFVVSDPNGIMLIPLINNGNIVVKNLTPVIGGWEMMPTVFNGIVLLKKMFSRRMNRFLTLHEMVQTDMLVSYNGKKYDEMEIDIVENSSDEILAAIIEMEERINGTWIETEDDFKRQSMFKLKIDELARKFEISINSYTQVRIGASFLADNYDLLGI